MQFTIAAAVLALASSVFAQDPTKNFTPITKPLEGEVVAAGSTYTITWQDTTGAPITISLLGGKEPALLVPISTIACKS
jgi:uncharacterized protein (DUF697 family)